MKNRPIIAVTCSFDEDAGSYKIHQDYVQALANSGAIPYVIPNLPEEDIDSQVTVADVDGLLFSGGTDFDPNWFDEEPRYKLSEIVPDRDSLEIELVKEAMKTGLPFLGICRGIQAVNVAAGGSIYQDIGSQVEDSLRHQQDAPTWHPIHQIEIDSRSLLAEILEATSLQVNSFHHQAINQVADGFKVTATASDGIIEGIEADNGNFQIGVQWHPERMWRKHPIHEKLFSRLIDEAKR